MTPETVELRRNDGAPVEAEEHAAALDRGMPFGPRPDPQLDRWTALVLRETDAAVAAVVLEHGEELHVRSLATPAGFAARTSVLGRSDPLAAHLLAQHPVATGSGTPTSVQVPICVDGGRVGWVAVADRDRETWSESDLRTLEDVAAAVSTELRLRDASRENDRVHDLLASNNGVHELIAQAAPLQKVFEELLAGIERYDPTVLPAVVLFDRASGTLHPGAGPSLPPEYLAAIDGVVVGPNVGTCGAAAWSGRLMITQDIAEDPKWLPVREFALGFGLRHCWSMPIKAPDGDVLGTLALYGRQPRLPQPEHLALMRDGARLAGIAIERSRAMDRLLHDARHDGLTGLANRTAIFEHLDDAIAHIDPDEAVAVLFVDLDGLKALNDTYGHDRADELIREIGTRLATAVRPRDFVGRFGGDEFIVVAQGVRNKEEAAEIGARLLAEISQPLPGIESAVITASIGISVMAGTAGDAREAIRQADTAMYAAKRSGRDRMRFFMGREHTRAGRRLSLERQLKDAESRGEMRLVYQPVFDLARNQLVAVEALLRWTSPTFGAVAPSEFIPIAEDSGAIVPLGAWVLRESCETIGRVNADTGRSLELGVNVSARQVAKPGFAKSVRQTLAHTRFPAELLTVEITETALLRPDAVTIRTLHELEDLGVRIVLDDFGTGYSSFAWLKRHPLDAIKIDRDFVSGLPGNVTDEAVVAAVIGLSRALGCTVTAEGVETEEQLQTLRELGCERVQGFLLARPLSPAQLVELLQATPAADGEEPARPRARADRVGGKRRAPRRRRVQRPPSA